MHALLRGPFSGGQGLTIHALLRGLFDLGLGTLNARFVVWPL